MASSYHSKVRSTEKKGVIFLFCLRHGLQYYFPMQARHWKFFQAGEVSWNYGTSIKISSKTHEKRPRRERFWRFFFLNTIKTTFRIKNLTQKWTQLVPFFPKIGALISIFKKEQGRSPPFSLVTRLPCLDEAKVSTVNSDLTNFVDVQRLHENIK